MSLHIKISFWRRNPFLIDQSFIDESGDEPDHCMQKSCNNEGPVQNW